MRLAALALAGVILGGGVAVAQEDKLPPQEFSFDGPFGTFDRAAAQRGLQVYLQVCSNCHSLKEAYYRNLTGIGLSQQQVKDIAANITVPGELNDQGEPTERPALPSDHFRSPFPNDKAARAANNGALPPDQSVIEKARDGGATYIADLLQGYRDPPPGVKVQDGLYYNEYFPGHQIAMPPPLSDGQVTYADGTKATVAQMSHDVATFLTFIANPEMEQRKSIGVKMVLFLAGMTAVTYAVKRKIWSNLH
jgi:ubiquinol-cytochrome c reductase cytochrome c1 subunit